MADVGGAAAQLRAQMKELKDAVRPHIKEGHDDYCMNDLDLGPEDITFIPCGRCRARALLSHD